MSGPSQPLLSNKVYALKFCGYITYSLASAAPFKLASLSIYALSFLSSLSPGQDVVSFVSISLSGRLAEFLRSVK